MNLEDMANDWDALLYSMVSREANFTCGRCMQPQRWMFDKATGKILSRPQLIAKALVENRELPDVDNLDEIRKHMAEAQAQQQLRGSIGAKEDGEEEDEENEEFSAVREGALSSEKEDERPDMMRFGRSAGDEV